VQAFNAALAGVDLTDAIAAAGANSVTAAQGSFAIAQIVTGEPRDGVAGDGTASPHVIARTVLTVADGGLRYQSDPTGTVPADVTMVVAYDDAVAIARGELDPADALAAGRVRVRGELAVLVAGQVVLNAASAALGTALTDLTDLTDLGQ
jgi:hypothetical protein